MKALKIYFLFASTFLQFSREISPGGYFVVVVVDPHPRIFSHSFLESVEERAGERKTEREISLGGRQIDFTCTLTRLEIELAAQVGALDLESNPSPFNVGSGALTTRHHWPGLVAILFFFFKLMITFLRLSVNMYMLQVDVKVNF